MLVGVWDIVPGATWDETYAKLGSGGMNREGVGEAGVFTRRYILALPGSPESAMNLAADFRQMSADNKGQP